MHEFKVNEYITLKLENGSTNIYVKGTLFRQCKYLLLNIPQQESQKYAEIDSIDEAEKKLDRSMELDHSIIPPETEFWGHCSNLQAWTENDYDTRILHRNLAFPLLERLYQAGDPQATQVFKEEIASRYESGYRPVIEYLQQNQYIRALSKNQIDALSYDPKAFRRVNHLDMMIIGDPEVGTKTLADHITFGEFIDARERDSKMENVDLKVQHKWITVNDVPYLFFYYTYGESLLEKPVSLHMFRRALGVILLFDLSNRNSYNNIPRWVKFLREVLIGKYDDTTIVLVGAKKDLKEREVSEEEGYEMAKRYNFFYQECSAKTGENTKGLFENTAYTIIERIIGRIDDYYDTKMYTLCKYCNKPIRRSSQMCYGCGKSLR